jgi:hypothetical protein
MPTPPVYTSDFEVIGGLAEAVTNGSPSWGYFRSAVIAPAAFAVDYAANTSSYDYTAAAYPSITATTDTLFRTWFPFQLQLLFNQTANPSHFVVRGWVFPTGDIDDEDRPFVAEEDFAGGVVGATVTAYDLSISGSANFIIALESGNHNGIAQDTVSFQGPITAIVLP